jgi:CPA2 family monovalent cation:H+ antiporter-2
LFLTIAKLLFFSFFGLSPVFSFYPHFKEGRNLLDEETLLIRPLAFARAWSCWPPRWAFQRNWALIMGSILAETTKAEKVEHLIKPVKDLFGAVFFVSVGMLIDPVAIKEYGWAVILVTLLTIFGKFLSTTSGALISGQTLKQSVQVGMSMAQIGEFAFIVATLGLSLGVISDFLFPVAVGASAITTLPRPISSGIQGRPTILLQDCCHPAG